MFIWFFASVFGLLIAAYLHVKSVQHIKLKKLFGAEKGEKRGETLAKVSGWLESICLVGLWISPQASFTLTLFTNKNYFLLGRSFSLTQIFISLPFIFVGIWFGLVGLWAVGFDVADSHKIPKTLQTSGVYGYVRHPQYFGWFMAHIGFSILLSALYSLLFIPVLLTIIYIISKAEESDLEEAFGKEYLEYEQRVPMFIPKILKRSSTPRKSN